MPRVQLESTTDAFDLGTRATSALIGVSGAGLPPVHTQWNEGAGDGAVWRGTRVRPRDLDLPILLQAASRTDLRALTTRLARMLSGPMTLRFVEDDGTSWTLDVRWVGGGDVVLGADTDANTYVSTVVTLRAGDPFWTSSQVSRQVVTAVSGRGLLGPDPDDDGPLKSSLVHLRVSASQTLGAFTMVNPGDAPAYPVWTIDGPGENLVVESSTGESFTWLGTLEEGEQLIVDTRAATVIDGTGTSRYSELGPAPRLWRVPPGTTTANVSFDNTDSGHTRIVAEWRARRWMVV